MPVLRGDCRTGKPVTDIVIAPILPEITSVQTVGSASKFDVTPLRALLDTGADGTSISSQVVQSHRLRNFGKRTVVGIGGPGKHNTWGVFVGFLFQRDSDFEGDGHHAQSLFMVPEAKLAVEIPTNSYFDVIIGRDILNMYDFRISKGWWELALE